MNVVGSSERVNPVSLFEYFVLILGKVSHKVSAGDCLGMQCKVGLSPGVLQAVPLQSSGCSLLLASAAVQQRLLQSCCAALPSSAACICISRASCVFLLTLHISSVHMSELPCKGCHNAAVHWEL